MEFFIAAIKEKYNEKNAQKIINYQMDGQFNKTAIHLAIEHNRRETGKLLISHSAEVNNTTAIGYTPLDRAFGVGAGWAIEDLVAKKAHRNLCKGNFRQPGASRRSEAVAAEMLSLLPPPDADAALPASPWRAKMLLRTLGTSLPPLGAGVARYLPTPIPQAINGAGWAANSLLTLNNEGRSKQPFGLKYCAEVSRKIPLLLLAAGASLGSTVAAMYYTYRINSASKEEQATMDAEKRNEAALNVMTALLVPVARAVHHSRYGSAVNAVVGWPVRALVKRWRRGAALTNGEVAGSIALTQVVIGVDEEKKEAEASPSSSRESSVSREGVEKGEVEEKVDDVDKAVNKNTSSLAPTLHIRRSEERHTSKVIRSRSCPPDPGRIR